jgi:light-regulated signal transduction histidine kinase (bacteriophytochrome)
MVHAEGVALVSEDAVQQAGNVPSDAELGKVTRMLRPQIGNSHAAADPVRALVPPSGAKGASSHILALTLSHNPGRHLLWFKRRVAQEAPLGRNQKNGSATASAGLAYDDSAWSGSTLNGGEESHLWSALDVSAVSALRRAIMDGAFDRAERLARRNRQLEDMLSLARARYQSFRETVLAACQRLQAPSHKIQSFSRLLREEYSETQHGRTSSPDPSRDADAPHAATSDDTSFYIGRLQRSASTVSARLADLIEYLLLGDDLENPRPVDLTVVLEQVERSTALKLEDIEGSMSYRDLPRVIGNARDLLRMFERLIEHAIETADPSRRLSITVGHDAHDGQDGMARILLSLAHDGTRDHGSGPGYAPSPAVQQATDTESFGREMAVAFVRRIAERHGGGMTVSPGLADDITIEIRLPTC